jgi:hypothetical protein
MTSVTMRCAILLLLSSASAFVPVFTRHTVSTERFMFGGSGGGAPLEDNPEMQKAMEQGAAALGMSVDEYSLGMKARMKFEADISSLRLSSGNSDIGVQVDGNAPPAHLVVTITDAGKAKGADVVSKELVSAFKSVNEKAKKGRTECQQSMMKFISENMKA